MRKGALPLLVVDGYNVIHGTPRYAEMIDEHAGAGALADVAHLSRDPYGHDPFDRVRQVLVADVAAYAQRSYEPVIVFDGSGNLSENRPDFSRAGVRVVFSRTGEDADTVIERLVTKARHDDRDVLLVTSDNTIRFTVGRVEPAAGPRHRRGSRGRRGVLRGALARAPHAGRPPLARAAREAQQDSWQVAGCRSA